ncbi:thiamine pyrophosphate-binding protein [Pontibacillus yanchengensis]|uniref:Thiamine pyrophosphate-binding protein n=1 Tax=Pontibacillus yanchengensis TaxID=462910 RepID=A0A6I4ZUK2_9BACI|nr:thiamine pyrophosphate-binding protein [Pontibacillus yanchengensis]MYL33905.1 thiamine pyrophosphate-binding protein [Pontibacillus yanchengensis]
MKATRAVLDYLKKGGVEYIFGIPAGSVNAMFDELYEIPEITPIITKHEGAASYMACSYAKYSNSLSVCIGSSGPGGTNLVSGAANAMREHLPVLFFTGAVPVPTMGLNASQELDAKPVYDSITKYSVTVQKAEDLLGEVVKAVEIALSGVPGPVHVALPIDVQLEKVTEQLIPDFPQKEDTIPTEDTIKHTAQQLIEKETGYLFVGQGIRGASEQVIELAELLDWPIITTPQAKGYIPDDHPLFAGIFGFAGHENASQLMNDGEGKTLFVIGSSLGETATNNYNTNLAKDRYVIQMDFDESVFNRKYEVDIPLKSDIQPGLRMLNAQLESMGLSRTTYEPSRSFATPTEEYNTQNVLHALQQILPVSNRYTIDIGEFMAYVVHHMDVFEPNTFDINVHFGAMGSAIGGAIGSHLAEPERPVTCITGDGCFFMHGMEMLTAKEYNMNVLFVVLNNARLGMVYHGHTLQYKRSHERLEQDPVDIAAMAKAAGVPSTRIEDLHELTPELVNDLRNQDGPAVLEVSLVDSNIPPMGDRVKFLSSFGK